MQGRSGNFPLYIDTNLFLCNKKLETRISSDLLIFCMRYRELSTVSDVMTVEIEHVNTEILDILVSEGKQIHPKPSTIRMIQVPASSFTAFESFYSSKCNFLFSLIFNHLIHQTI